MTGPNPGPRPGQPIPNPNRTKQQQNLIGPRKMVRGAARLGPQVAQAVKQNRVAQAARAAAQAQHGPSRGAVPPQIGGGGKAPPPNPPNRGPVFRLQPARPNSYQIGANIASAFPTADNTSGGMQVNRHIIIAVVVIASVGALNAWLLRKPVTRVVVGAIVLLFFLSLADAVGGPFSSLASALSMLVMLSVMLVELPSILQAFGLMTSPTFVGGAGHSGNVK